MVDKVEMSRANAETHTSPHAGEQVRTGRPQAGFNGNVLQRSRSCAGRFRAMTPPSNPFEYDNYNSLSASARQQRSPAQGSLMLSDETRRMAQMHISDLEQQRFPKATPRVLATLFQGQQPVRPPLHHGFTTPLLPSPLIAEGPRGTKRPAEEMDSEKPVQKDKPKPQSA